MVFGIPSGSNPVKNPTRPAITGYSQSIQEFRPLLPENLPDCTEVQKALHCRQNAHFAPQRCSAQRRVFRLELRSGANPHKIEILQERSVESDA
jgi:hypothetical protein